MLTAPTLPARPVRPGVRPGIRGCRPRDYCRSAAHLLDASTAATAAPGRNALGSVMLAMSLIIVILGYAGYRLLTRGERGASRGRPPR